MEEEEEADVSGKSVEDVLCYRQRAEKSTGGQMVHMAWSPTMDVLAASFADRSVGRAVCSLSVSSACAVQCVKR